MTHTILTVTTVPPEGEPIERLRVRIEGEIDPARVGEIYRLLNQQPRRRRSDAGKPRTEKP